MTRWMRPAGQKLAPIVIAASLVATSLLLSGAPAMGAVAPCKVANLATGRSHGTLQRAVNGASAGATLRVTGVCKGSTTIGKNLTIKGKRTTATGAPALSGGGNGRVLTIKSGAVVTVRALSVRNGKAIGVTYPDSVGGGIFNSGTLTLIDSVVEKNTALDSGGGIRSMGPLTLLRTIVRKNTVKSPGGDACGMSIEGELTMTDSASVGNHPAAGGACTGGGIMVWSGTSTIGGTSVVVNNRSGSAAGGGIGIYLPATLNMRGTSSVTGNTSGGIGGGVWLLGRLSLDGNLISGNVAVTGGGVYLECDGKLGGVAGDISGNTPDQVFVAPC